MKIVLDTKNKNTMKKATLIILSLFVFNCTFGQDTKKYNELVKEAQELYQSKDYLQSGQKYNEAVIALGGKGYVPDRYNAACAWALANEADSAFVHLFKIAEKGYYTYLEHITADTNLMSLCKDERWGKVVEMVRNDKEKAEAKYDKSLIAMLDTIRQDDQQDRLKIDSIREKYGADSEEYKELWQIIHLKDSINIIKVKKILDERGWLGADVVGSQGNTTLFLVIQHSSKGTREQYLPMMREAVKNGNARASDLALLEDRVALGKGEKQIYGSQIGTKKDEYYVRPLIDPDNVDKRRAEVELPPIQLYVSNWGITWDVEEYKKKLPEYEEKEWGKKKENESKK
jgi:hypothetical protein